MRGEPRSDHPLERIRGHLVSLRMPRALEMLDHLVQQIERGQVGTIEAIEALLAEELTIRETRRIKAALQMARLSTIKTLSGLAAIDAPEMLGLTADGRSIVTALTDDKGITWRSLSLEDGSFGPAYARCTAILGSNFLSKTWRVHSEANAPNALLRASGGFAGRMAANAFEEFWPDVKKRVFRKRY